MDIEDTKAWFLFIWRSVISTPINKIRDNIKCINCYVAHKKYHDGHFSFVTAGECTCKKCGYHWNNPQMYI